MEVRMKRWMLLTMWLAIGLAGCRVGNGTPGPTAWVAVSPTLLPAPPATRLPLRPEVTPMSPGQEMIRATVYLEAVEVVTEDGQPWLLLSGNLPTPCHRLQVQVQPPDAEHRIRVQVFSVVKRGEMCVEVLAPFQERVALSTTPLPAGTYQVVVNGGAPIPVRVP